MNRKDSGAVPILSRISSQERIAFSDIFIKLEKLIPVVA
jgi:hypothetical protein